MNGAGTQALQVPPCGRSQSLDAHTTEALIAATKLVRKSLNDLDVVSCIESWLRKEHDLVSDRQK